MNITDGAAVADAFALGGVFKFAHAADGMMARIWRLDSTSGRYAVKEHRDFVDVNELASRLESSAQLAVSAWKAGVVSPRAVRDSAGELVHRLENEDGADPVQVSVSTWIDGRPLQLADDVAEAAAWLGSTVAAIELAPDPPDAPSLDPWLMTWLTTTPSRFAWQTVLEHAKIADKSWADLLATRVDQLARLATVVTPDSDLGQSVLHTDLQPKNVLVTSAGFALLDWDDAARCSRDRILARTLIEWLTPGGIRADLIPVFMNAYWSQGGRGVIDDVKAFGYAVAAFLNHLHEMADSDSRADRRSDDASRAIVAGLTRPLDISTLEAVLKVVKAAASSRQSLERRDGSDR